MDGMELPQVVVGTGPVSPEDVLRVARHGHGVRLADDAVAEIARSRAVVDGLAKDEQPHYGISTGFGALATKHIPLELRAQLQRSLIRSHAAGSGPEVEREVVRALMLLRLSTLATGRTGVRVATASAYAAMLDAGITPVVHEYGSLGCSGDLAPLSLDRAGADGRGLGARRRREAAGRPPRRWPRPASSRSCWPRRRASRWSTAPTACSACWCWPSPTCAGCSTTADVAAAMSVEALLGTDAVFAADLQALRPHPGQADSAANLRALLAGSGVMASHRGPECTRVQDAYSLRCAPQVHGAARDTVAHAADRRRPGAGLGHRQPGGHPGRPGGVQRQLPRRPGRLRARLPGHRGRRRRQHERAAHRPVPRPLPAATGCRRSWPATRASTRAT